MTCRAFDALALERGTLDDAHVAGCAECRAAHVDYLATARAVRDARELWHPPAGWEARLDRAIAARHRRRRIAVAAGAFAAAAIAIVVFAARGGERDPEPPSLALAVARGAGIVRGDAPRVGDRLQLRAATGGAPHAELRVYRSSGALVLRCAAACRTAHRLAAELVLPAIGRYRAVLLTGAREPPAPTGSFDDDTAAARQAGAHVVLSEELDVL